MPTPDYLREAADSVLLAVKVQPRASRNEIAGAHGSELRIRLTAPPVESAANIALVEYLARVLDCPRSAITLVRGQTSRHKQLRIHGLPATVVAARLSNPES